MQVQNMRSARGNTVPNQFIINHNGEEFFQSYRVIIAKKGDGKTFLDSYYWDYSATTGKYRNDFLGEGIADTRAKIESKQYYLTNLNK